MSTQREVRYLVATEVRAKGGSGDADPLRIEGYAAVYNRAAQLPGFQERIQPNAFKRAIDSKQDVVCLFNHDSNLVLGRTTSGTLRVDQDDRGLHYVCDLPNTQAGRDTHESIKRGDVTGCSFAFTVPDGGQRWSEQEDTDGTFFVMRDLTDLNLHDVSPVTYPTYGGTNVYARSTDAIEAPAELRSAVETKNAAKRGMMDMKEIDVPAKKENPVDPTQNAEPEETEEEKAKKEATEKAEKEAAEKASVERAAKEAEELRFAEEVAILKAASEIVPAPEPWHSKYLAVAAGAISATEAMRYATDQPRNNGSFGTTNAELASSMNEHCYAVRAHTGKASAAMDAENHSAAMSHLRAAHGHAEAARAHKEKSEDRFAYSVKAQTGSKEANRSY